MPSSGMFFFLLEYEKATDPHLFACHKPYLTLYVTIKTSFVVPL